VGLDRFCLRFHELQDEVYLGAFACPKKVNLEKSVLLTRMNWIKGMLRN
jgi:hypothetical protein